jgi:imidazoleglycerol-phosphate dehydratase
VSARESAARAGWSARVVVGGTGRSNVATGISVLDHLLALLTRYACFDLALEVAPAPDEAEVTAAGRALGEALAGPLHANGARAFGSASLPADEALAHVALEASASPRLVTNVDLSDERIGGVASDVVGAFLHELALGAGLTLHVRLIEGEDPQHVLDAIFKTLGVALAQACRPGRREEANG